MQTLLCWGRGRPSQIFCDGLRHGKRERAFGSANVQRHQRQRLNRASAHPKIGAIRISAPRRTLPPSERTSSLLGARRASLSAAAAERIVRLKQPLRSPRRSWGGRRLRAPGAEGGVVYGVDGEAGFDRSELDAFARAGHLDGPLAVGAASPEFDASLPMRNENVFM